MFALACKRGVSVLSMNMGSIPICYFLVSFDSVLNVWFELGWDLGSPY